TIVMRDLFFNVPARRKFLRSKATESFHLTNLVTHYALAHPEIGFTLMNNGREILRAPVANDLRERAYQLFGAEFLENLLEVDGGHQQVVTVRGYVSAPRDRRTSRDAQYLFVNGRFVRDRLISRALSEGYRAILPHGVYPAALLFLETPLEEVDVNVHPAKTEVRFRRNAAVADAVREAVRSALASAGYVRTDEAAPSAPQRFDPAPPSSESVEDTMDVPPSQAFVPAQQERMAFSVAPAFEREALNEPTAAATAPTREPDPIIADRGAAIPESPIASPTVTESEAPIVDEPVTVASRAAAAASFELPPLASADKFVREVAVESLSPGIRPLGQLDESFIIATDDEGLLLIDQHVAHERVLFDKYRSLEAARVAESQQLLIPETFDLTPAQAAVFDSLAPELETYGFNLMRLSGRTVA